MHPARDLAKKRAFIPTAAVLLALSGVGAIGAALPFAAHAQGADPAAGVIEGVDTGLLALMRASGGQAARERVIAPVIDRAFDLPLMTRLSVGPAWLQASAHDQAALVSAFRAMTIAQYAKNFSGFSGQHFQLDPAVETRGSDKLVRTTLISPGDEPEQLNYRMRQNGGGWKVIDVYYRNAISQLATRRSDFASVLAHGGAPALVAHLNALAANPK